MTSKESRKFGGDQTIYHYTSINTAIEHIFPSNRLRLSPLSASADPMERISPILSVAVYGYQEDHDRLNKNFDGNEIISKIKNFNRSLRQLCFCRNAAGDDFRYNTGVFQPLDHYGFAKPRMWDQYGDGYTGVCIALSRPQLEEYLPEKFETFDVQYSKNHLFKPFLDSTSVSLNQIEEIGVTKYLENRQELELRKLCTKHYDYRDENELKLIASVNENYAYLDIRNSIQGLFFTNRLNYAYEGFLMEIANDYDIPLVKIRITHEGIEPLIYRGIGKDL